MYNADFPIASYVNDLLGRSSYAKELAHTILVCQYNGNGCIVGLPKGANQEESEAYQNSAFVVEFHRDSSMSFSTSFIIVIF